MTSVRWVGNVDPHEQTGLLHLRGGTLDVTRGGDPVDLTDLEIAGLSSRYIFQASGAATPSQQWGAIYADQEGNWARDSGHTLVPISPADIDHNTGYDVVLCAGQSNMVGRGLPVDNTYIDISNPRIDQFAGSGTYQGQIISAVDPLAHHEFSTGIGPSMMFARDYVRTLQINRKVLLVPVAHGGTGFTTSSLSPPPSGKTNVPGGSWDPADTGINLPAFAISQANAAMAAAGPNARFIAILWVQGEADMSAMTQTTYGVALDALIDLLRSSITGATSKTPFVIGQMVPGYFLQSNSRTAINTAHVETPYRKTSTSFAYGPNDGWTDIHYDSPRSRLVGHSMYPALARAVANITGSIPSAPSTVALAQVGTRVNVSWTQPVCRTTNYNVRYALQSSSTWTDLVRARSIDVVASITGLTLGSTYVVQVQTVNEDGVSDWTQATITLVALPAQTTGLNAASSGPRSITLAYNAAARATSYLAEISPAGAGTWSTVGTTSALSIVASGLNPLTSYDFRVTSINAAGNGTVSATFTTSTTASLALMSDVGVAADRAYGLRKLVSTYAGSAIRVRRSSDNTEQDIGFVSNSGLDTASLLTFAGAGSAFVKTLYDQSGNARNLSQTTTTLQPMIVSSGALVTANGLPAWKFDGVDDLFLDTVATLYPAGVATVLEVLLTTGSGLTQIPWGEGNSASSNQRYVPTFIGSTGLINVTINDDAGTAFASGSSSQALGSGAIHQNSMVDSGTNIANYLDGGSPLNVAYSRAGHTVTLNNFALGCRRGTATLSPFSGYMSEFVSWTSALSTAQRQAGEANQKAWFGTP